jgi:chromosome segregation ATPase
VYRSIELYRSMLEQAHPQQCDVPDWLVPAIEYLEQSVSEVRLLRQQLRAAAEKATTQEEQTRAPRVRIGRALDELAKDDSRLGRQIERLSEALTLAEARLDTAMRAIFEGAANAAATKAGQALTEKEAFSLAKVVEGARRLASERDSAMALRTELETRRREHNDLRFQIAELKEQLQVINGSATVDQQLAHDEVNRLSAHIQAKLDAIAPYANRISQHFAQFSELRAGLAPRPLGADPSLRRVVRPD